jgi:iron-sulfur cluster repair protein YtfE (RIC family)
VATGRRDREVVTDGPVPHVRTSRIVGIGDGDEAPAERVRAMTATAEGAQVWAFTEHEHRDLVRGLNRIHDVACEIGRRPRPEVSIDVLDVLHWLDASLEPHMAWEEHWLYPEIDARTGTSWSTRAARFDHQQIREMAVRLRTDQHALLDHEAVDQHGELRCHLFGLEALLRSHIEREERFLIPLLDDEPSATGEPCGEPMATVHGVPSR